MSKANIFIVYYSMYGHVKRLAEEIKKGIEKVPNVVATIYQVPETLPKEVLTKMYAPPKADHPIITAADLVKADGILFGIPTRFGSSASQMQAFMDSTGGLWKAGALIGKPAGVFFSTSSLGGGQETTALTFLTQLTHHGMIFVPIGYVNPVLGNLTEVHGGSPYGAGTISAVDGSRQPSDLELSVALSQGEHFAKVVKTMVLGRQAVSE